MKAKKLIKRISAAFLALLMFFSASPLTGYASPTSTSGTFGVISGSYAKYGHELHYTTQAGVSYILWCVQYGKTSPTGATYTQGTDYYASKNSSTYDTVGEFVYFGYTLQFGDTTSSLSSSSTFAGLTAQQCACACQQYVWQAIGGKYPSKSSWNSTYMGSDIYSTWYSATKALINEYHNAAVSFDGIKITLEAGESTTLTDSNGYLQYYPTFEKTIKNVTYAHTKGSNSMTVSVSSSATAGKTSTFNSADTAEAYIAIPKDTGWSETVTYNSEYNFDMYYGFYSYQNLFYSKFANPESTQDFTVQVTIEETPPLTGDLTIVKTADDSAAFGGDMSIFKFKITSTDGYSKSVKLGADGTYTLTGLDVYDDEGNLIVYTIKEKDKPTRYVTPATQSVTLKEDTTVKVSFNNTPKTGDLYVYKSSDDGVIKNIKFTITWTYAGKEYTQSETTNSEGIAKFTDLDVYDIDDTKIVYTISEADVPTRYYTPDEIEVKLITSGIQEVDFSNDSKMGSLTIVKTSYDGIVEGFKFNVSYTWAGKDYSNTYTTNEKGKIELEGLPIATFNDE